MSESTTQIPRKTLPWVIIGAIVLVIAIIGIWVFVTWQNVISDGNKKQAALNAAYSDGANYLSSCLVKTQQAANVAGAEADALSEVFADAISARNYGSEGGALDEGALFSAVVEAYPDTTGLQETFQQVVAVIVGCRDDYAAKQTVVLNQTRAFEGWLGGSWEVRTFGGDFPNEKLTVTIGDRDVTGAAALAIMKDPIVDNSTLDAYENGSFEIEDPFQDEASAQ